MFEEGAVRGRIAILQKNDQARARLVAQLEERGFEVSCHSVAVAAAAAMHLDPPDLIVVDADAELETTPPFSAIRASSPVLRLTPIIFASGSLEARTAASADPPRLTTTAQTPTPLISSIEKVFASRARRRSSADASRQERLATLGLVTAGVAHEVNSPLAAIVMILHELNATLPESATSARLLVDDALEAASHIRNVVRDIQDLSRTGSSQREALEIHRVLDSALRLVRVQFHDRARVVKEYGPTPKVVASDGRLGQLFINLLVNAAQAIPPGRESDNLVRITTATGPLGECVVEIADTGVGIEPEHLAHIFETFYTTRRESGGSGLGLALCHAIATSVGGRIEVQSEAGRGTTFRVVLPSAYPGELSRPITNGPPRRSRPPAVVRRVLVAEPDAMLARALARSLSSHQVLVATSLREAIDATQESDFDLILCELALGDGTGVELVNALSRRGSERERNVVFMTAGAEPVPKVSNRVLQKPFDIRDVLEILEGEPS